MELLCTEGNTITRAFADPVYLKDERVLHNLMKLEEYYTVPANHMDRQTDIKPYMRKIVTQWMLEVNNSYQLLVSSYHSKYLEQTAQQCRPHLINTNTLMV